MDQEPRQLPPLGGGSNYEQVPPQTPYYEEKPRRIGFAVTSLVLGIISIIGLCCCFGVVTAPIAIVFGIISLATKRDGKGLSITGIVLGGVTLLIAVSFMLSLRPVFRHLDVITEDMTQLIQDQDEVFPAYEEDHTLPDYLRKYLEPPYSDMLEKYDVTIYDIMDGLLVQYKQGEFPRLDGSSKPASSAASSAADTAAPETTAPASLPGSDAVSFFLLPAGRFAAAA